VSTTVVIVGGGLPEKFGWVYFFGHVNYMLICCRLLALTLFYRIRSFRTTLFKTKKKMKRRGQNLVVTIRTWHVCYNNIVHLEVTPAAIIN